jgi:AAA domain-containing protein
MATPINPVSPVLDYSPEQNRAYFQAVLSCVFNGHVQQTIRCPFHDDGNASLSLNWDKGTWNCHAGCGSGGILDFEEKFSNCTRDVARANVASLLGVALPSTNGRVLEAEYIYGDALGVEQFRQQRFSPKGFSCYRLVNGKRVDNIKDIPNKPLYRQAELARSAYVLLFEGEKKVDLAMSMNLSRLAGLPMSATTSFGGAANWRPEYAVHFVDKRVAIFPDNDSAGEAYAMAAAASIHPYAALVKIVRLPGLLDKADIVDWIAAGHTAEELIAAIQTAPLFIPPCKSCFKTCVEIAAESAKKADWILPHFVERTAMTELTGKIKSGKTTLAFDACRAVLDGGEFLGQQCAKGSVVLITEQSGFSLNEALGRACLLDRADMTVCRPSDAFGLTWPALTDAAIEECERCHPALLLVDTLNGLAQLKGDDENSAGAMLQIMRQLERAKGRGWGILVTAHERKSGGAVYDAARGSSAAGGVFDILMSLRRPEGNHPPTVRKISSISRLSETPSELIIDWNEVDCRYSVLGDLDSIALARARAKVMSVLPTDQAEAKTIEELKEETGESESTLRRVLKEFANLGPGRKGSPARYYQRTAGGEQ